MLATAQKVDFVVRQMNTKRESLSLASPRTRSAYLSEIILGVVMGQASETAISPDDVFQLRVMAEEEITRAFGYGYLG
jgi:hypothetical protein